MLTPPLFLYLYRKLFGPKPAVKFISGYKDWNSTRTKSLGYDQEEILSKVIESTRAVATSNNIFERDGYIVEEKPEENILLLSILLCQSISKSSKINVIDFGGALGTSYRATRSILSRSGSRIDWRIVEQHNFVKAGIEFQNNELTFFEKISECAFTSSFTMVFASVLQYIEEPKITLAEALKFSPTVIVIKDFPVSNSGNEEFMIQIVNPRIVASSYAARRFPSNFLEILKIEGYAEILDQLSKFQPDSKATYHDKIFIKNLSTIDKPTRSLR